MSHRAMMDYVDIIWHELEEYGRSYLFQPDWNAARLSILFETIESMAKDYGVELVIAKIRDERYEIYLRYMGDETV